MAKTTRQDITGQVIEHQKVISKLLNDKKLMADIEAIINMVVDVFNKGHKVWFCGNGGSAADAQHLASELSGKFYLDRAALPAEALHTNSSFITAVGNDYNFDHIYSRALEAHAGSQDVLFLLSTSGNSPNLVKAINTAKNLNIFTIAITGDSNNKLRTSADFKIVIPSQDTPRIQEGMMLVGHIICCEIEKRMFVK